MKINKVIGTVLILALSACVAKTNTDSCTLLTPEEVVGDVTLEEGCYIVEENLVVDQGLLTLEPGVKIIFSREVGLTIEGENGALSAQGTLEKRVILTSADLEPGSWTGLYFDNSSSSKNILDFTTIEFGGGKELGRIGKANLGIGAFVGASKVALKNSKINASSGFGVVVEGESSISSFEKNEFSANANFALRIKADQRAIVDSATIFDGNVAINGIEIYGGNIVEKANWLAVSGDAFTSVTAPVAITADLIISEGTMLEFGDNIDIQVNKTGSLVCNGTAENQIVFTAASKMPGFWKGVYFDASNSSVNHLNHVIIEYGGSSEVGSGLGKSNLAIGAFVGTSSIKIENSFFRFSAGYGIEVELSNVISTFDSNTFESNADYALRIPGNVRQILDDTTLFLDTTSYVEVFESTVDKDAVWKNLSESAFTSVTGNLTAAVRFELNPGVNLHFGDNVQFTIDGRSGGVFIAQGTDADPIIFTRLGNVQWRGIYFDNSEASENIISDAIIEYGGFSEIDGQKANLVIGGFVGTSALIVKNVTISNSDGVGIYIETDNMVNADIATVNEFLDNAAGDVVSQ